MMRNIWPPGVLLVMIFALMMNFFLDNLPRPHAGDVVINKSAAPLSTLGAADTEMLVLATTAPDGTGSTRSIV